MSEIVDEMGVQYTDRTGAAAFYDPKVDIQVQTMMGHTITISTVQLDFLLPLRFDLNYIAEGGHKERPVVIHRGLISTWERLMSILIEQYRGAFPTWLAPIQATVIPVSNAVHLDYSTKIYEELFDKDIRVELDTREEKLGYKIRAAQTQKIPYQLVVGDNEVEQNLVTYRKYGSQEQTTIKFEEFKLMILDEIKTKKR